MAGECSQSVADKTTDTLHGRVAVEWMDADRLRTCEHCGLAYWCWKVELWEANNDLCGACWLKVFVF
jgi:hypothetical protein